jgi:hypothetical protein
MLQIFKPFFKNCLGHPYLFIGKQTNWKMSGVYPFFFECTKACSITDE